MNKGGGRINLRGPLPSKKSANQLKVQRISLGLIADENGLKEAEKLLQLVLMQIKHGQFDWKHWRATEKVKTNKPDNIIQSIKSFESNFFLDPIRNKSQAGMKTTWQYAYLPYLRRLIKIANKKDQTLNIELLLETLKSYSENSRSRKQCGTALGAFARHLELQLPEDWGAQASGYGLSQTRFRALPSDSLIKEIWRMIPNPSWKLAYALMATYGLRNHEIFFCDLSCLAKDGDKILRVLPTTKTGEHQVWPFHPEWVKDFELEKLANGSNVLPKVNTSLKQTTLQKVGRRVAEQFRRYKLPLTPYDLRHAWAVRTIHIGIPDTVAARMMGHSVTIHTSTYHHWITRRDQQQAVDAALSKNVTQSIITKI